MRKSVPLLHFRHYATYRKLQKKSKKNSEIFFSQFLVFWELLLSPVVEKVVFVFESFWALDMAPTWAVPGLLTFIINKKHNWQKLGPKSQLSETILAVSKWNSVNLCLCYQSRQITLFNQWPNFFETARSISMLQPKWKTTKFFGWDKTYKETIKKEVTHFHRLEQNTQFWDTWTDAISRRCRWTFVKLEAEQDVCREVMW